MTLRIHDWDEHQTYRRDRNPPPWIKVHRDLLRKPKWVQLTDTQRGQLVGMWILAADECGKLPDDPALIRKLCYMDEEPDLEVFISLGFIDRDGDVTAERRQGAAPEAEAEAETEADKKTTGSASRPADVENSKKELPDYAKAPTYTLGELHEAANDVLGMKILGRHDQNTNLRILKDWIYGAGRDSMEVYSAIVGAADMRDKDLIGWEDQEGNPTAGPGTPMTLKALVRAPTLFDQGDGTVLRSLYDVAVDHYVKADTSPTNSKRGGGLGPVSISINRGAA